MFVNLLTLRIFVMILDSATRDNPPPNNYHLNFRLTERAKYDGVAFGFGGRINKPGSKKISLLRLILFADLNDNPGPGTYKISSKFDKFGRLPKKGFGSSRRLSAPLSPTEPVENEVSSKANGALN